MSVISPINTEAIKESAKNTVKSVVDWLNPLTHIRNLISNVRDTICKKVPLLSLILKKFESKEKTTEQESFGERLERGARETTKAVAKPMMSPEQYEQALKGSGEKAPETKNYYEKPEALQKVKNEKIRLDFIRASQSVSNKRLTVSPELDQEASLRLDALKKDPGFSHDEKLKERGIAENIEKIYIGSGINFAQKFENSPTHRKNMREFENMGVAMDGPIYDQAKDDDFYYVVALYSKGRTLEDKELPAPKKIDLKDNAKEINVFDEFSKALDEEIKLKGSKVARNRIDVSKNAEAKKAMDAIKQKKGGELTLHYEIFQDTVTGKQVHYIVQEDPPILIRMDKQGKIKNTKFRDVLADFSSVIAELNSDSEQKEGTAPSMTVEELEKTYNAPSAVKPGKESKEKAEEKTPPIVGLS